MVSEFKTLPFILRQHRKQKILVTRTLWYLWQKNNKQTNENFIGRLLHRKKLMTFNIVKVGTIFAFERQKFERPYTQAACFPCYYFVMSLE